MRNVPPSAPHSQQTYLQELTYEQERLDFLHRQGPALGYRPTPIVNIVHEVRNVPPSSQYMNYNMDVPTMSYEQERLNFLQSQRTNYYRPSY